MNLCICQNQEFSWHTVQIETRYLLSVHLHAEIRNLLFLADLVGSAKWLNNKCLNVSKR